MKTNMKFLMIGLLLLLAACGGEEPTPTPVPPTATAEPTETPVPPTETPVPPTVTPEPTEVPPTEVPEEEPTEVPVEESGSDMGVTADTSGFVEFVSEEGGYTMAHPEGWTAEGLFGFTIFASEQGLLELDSTPEDGVLMLVLGSPRSEFEGDSIDDILDQTIEEFTPAANADEVTIVSGPEEISINDQEAVTVTLTGEAEDGVEVTVVVTIVFGETQGVFVIGVTPSAVADQYLDTIAAVTSTVVVGEASFDFSDLGIDPPTVEFTAMGATAIGEAVSGDLGRDETAGWSFTASADTVVDIVVAPTDGSDLTLDVLDSEGISILELGYEDSGFSGEPEVLREISFPADGEYTIAVAGFAGSEGAYELTIYPAGEAPVDDNGSSGDGNTVTAIGGALTLSEPVEGEVADFDVIGWTFTASAGQTADVLVQPLGDYDLVLDVFDASGESIIGGTLDFGFSGEVELAEEVSFPADGEYTIAVSVFAGGEADYRIGVYPVGEAPTPAVVGASVTIDAGVVSLDEPVRGELPESEAAGWTLAVGEATVINIVVEPDGDFDVVVDVVDANGFSILPNGEVDEEFGTETLSGVELPAGGDYTIVIRGFAGDGGVYALSVSGQ